jgi:flagellar motor switch protein FliN/FliY
MKQNLIAQQASEKGTVATDLMVAATALDTSAMESHPAWTVISQFPTALSVSIPLHNLRVRDLLHLQSGQIVRTSWNCGGDVPLSIGALQIAWGEFDLLNGDIALRIVRLA